MIVYLNGEFVIEARGIIVAAEVNPSKTAFDESTETAAEVPSGSNAQ